MKFIPLTNSPIMAVVDDDDYELILSLNTKWYLSKGSTDSILSTRLKHIRLARLIMIMFITRKSQKVDHINGNIFENRKFNLRLCSSRQNTWNSKVRSKSNTSGYKGVCFCKFSRKWVASIRLNNKHTNLGRFVSKIEAAVAYDDAAILHFGEYARLNFCLYAA